MKRAILFSTLVLGLAACEMPDETGSTAAPATASAVAAVEAPASLSSDERLIWDSMTPQARAEAVEFIANGGTLTQFVSL